MNMKKSVWVLPLLAASAVLMVAVSFFQREAQKLKSAEDVQVSAENSFCAGDLCLSMYTRSGDPVYYTTDGSLPTLKSARYTDELIFEAEKDVQSCVLRARSYDEAAGTWGELFTRTYFYADTMEAFANRFSTYIVCITSDPYNLYDYEYGILTEGKVRDAYMASESYDPDLLTQPANFTQKGRDWEREAHIEILTADGKRVIDQLAGIRVFGHASRQSYRKSLKLYARDEYGTGSFAYPLFADNVKKDGHAQQSYERLVVRNHGTDRSVTLFREELFQTLISQIDGVDHKSVTPAAVYLNGEYYNFAWIQEVYDDRYMEETYGTSGAGYYEVVDVKREDEQEEEPDRLEQRARADYDRLKAYADRDLTDNEVFEEFSRLVDVENMLQYFAIETYIANWDWPQNNIKLYRYYSPGDVYESGRKDGRWRYLYYDMEAGFNLYNTSEEEWRSIEEAMDGNELFAAVMRRTDMQQKFAAYIENCIREYFTEGKVRAAVGKLKALRDRELSENIRYKKKQDESYSLSMESVEENIEVIYAFVKRRPQMMRAELKTLFGIE